MHIPSHSPQITRTVIKYNAGNNNDAGIVQAADCLLSTYNIPYMAQLSGPNSPSATMLMFGSPGSLLTPVTWLHFTNQRSFSITVAIRLLINTTTR